MNNITYRIKKTIDYLFGFLPRPLPIGKAQFEKMMMKVINTYDFPNLPSYRRTIATMIMHHAQGSHMASMYSFARAIKRAQANEIAFDVLEDLKAEEKKAQEAKLVEAST